MNDESVAHNAIVPLGQHIEEKSEAGQTEVIPVGGGSVGASTLAEGNRPLAKEGKVAVRVADPFGIAVLDDKGSVATYERGAVAYVTPEQARQLFRDGKVSPEEMRPEGAPPLVERR